MIAVVTDRVTALTVVENGVTLIPPFQPLDHPDEQNRAFAALVVAVDHDLRHHPRFQGWVERVVRPHLTWAGWDHTVSVAAGMPERPALESGRALFEHLPDGAVFAHDGETCVRVRPGHGYNALGVYDAQPYLVEDEVVVLYDPDQETPARLEQLIAEDAAEAEGDTP